MPRLHVGNARHIDKMREPRKEASSLLSSGDCTQLIRETYIYQRVLQHSHKTKLNNNRPLRSITEVLHNKCILIPDAVPFTAGSWPAECPNQSSTA